jgi:hypothetical protein
MARLETASSAQYLYAGALMWLVVVVVALVLLIQAIRGAKTLTRGAEIDGLEPQTGTQTMPSLVEELTAPLNVFWTWLEDSLLHCWVDKSWNLEGTTSMSSEEQTHTVYGTLPFKASNNRIIKKGMARLFLITIISMILLWIAQWLFWAGFIGLSMEEYVLMRAHTGFDLANCIKVLSP